VILHYLFWLGNRSHKSFYSFSGPTKLVVGVAFYGRGWTSANPNNNGVYQQYAKFEKTHSYAELARDYIDKQGFKRYWDDSAKPPYLWNADIKTFISYNDPRIVEGQSQLCKSKPARRNYVLGTEPGSRRNIVVDDL